MTYFGCVSFYTLQSMSFEFTVPPFHHGSTPPGFVCMACLLGTLCRRATAEDTRRSFEHSGLPRMSFQSSTQHRYVFLRGEREREEGGITSAVRVKRMTTHRARPSVVARVVAHVARPSAPPLSPPPSPHHPPAPSPPHTHTHTHTQPFTSLRSPSHTFLRPIAD